ncbi:MAG: HAD family phosphatase [Candidatus Omnitrophica bacterium]|nr:HAD family phosphatase [Candidatus Omnitrophota bacterium]
MNNHLAAILFDMDGVITNTMFYHYKAWQAVLHDEGIPITKHEIYQREGQKGITSLKEIFSKYNKPLSIKHGQNLLLKKEEFFNKNVRTRFIPGSRHFIKKIARRNIVLALVTGTSKHEIPNILPRKLLDSFHVVISGSDVQNGKPHPEPYLKALNALNINNKKQVVVIENAPFGIHSAKMAGLTCLALETSLPRKYLREANHVFRDFTSLSNFISRNYMI